MIFRLQSGLLHFPRDVSPIRLIQDVPATLRGPAGTRTVLVAVESVSVIVGQFLAVLNVPERHDPDMTPDDIRCAIGVAGMIDIPCQVRECLAVNRIAGIEPEDIDIALE
jgi:hypothetical protein